MKIDQKIEHKVLEYLQCVDWTKSSARYYKWNFDPVINAGDKKLSLFVDNIESFLYESGLNHVFHIFYLNQFICDEYNVRFVYGNKVGEYFPTSNYDIFAVRFLIKPPELKDHIIFTVRTVANYHDRSVLPYNRIYIDYDLLPETLKNEDKLFELINFLNDSRDVLLDNVRSLSKVYFLNKLLEEDISINLVNIYCLYLLKDTINKLSPELLILLLTYNNKIGLPLLLSGINEKEFKFPIDVGGVKLLWLIVDFLFDLINVPGKDQFEELGHFKEISKETELNATNFLHTAQKDVVAKIQSEYMYENDFFCQFQLRKYLQVNNRNRVKLISQIKEWQEIIYESDAKSSL